YLNEVQSPDYLSIDILPPRYAAYLEPCVELLDRWPAFLHLEAQQKAIRKVMERLRVVKPGNDRAGKLREFLREIDRRRGTDHLATFPEYADILDARAIESSAP